MSMIDQSRPGSDRTAGSPGNVDAAAEPNGGPLPLIQIDSKDDRPPVDFRELWRYRELLYFFAWRDIKVRYKQTELGVAWTVLQPLLTTGVFVVLFGLLMGPGQQPGAAGVPYALSTFCAILPWQFFAQSLTRASESLIGGQNLITKVYFPRPILPLSAVITGLVDLAIALLILAVMMVCYGAVPSWPVVTLPLFLLLVFVAALGLGFWLSALSALYRDFRLALPFLVRLGFFVSPVIFATEFIKDKLPPWALAVYGLNPMVGAIEGFRWALLARVEPPEMIFLVPSVLVTILLFVSGMYFFRRMERTVVDVI